MLQTINDKAKGILGWVIIALISVPFALWGIQEYVGGGPQPFAAKVNELEVTPAEFDRAVAMQKQKLETMFGGQLPESAAFNKNIKSQVINQLINRKLLENYIAEEGYNISDGLLVNNIHQMKAFQQDGKFLAKSYKEIVNSQGMSVSQFEYIFRQDLKVQQVQDGIIKTSFASPAEVKLVNEIQNQQRDISYVVFEESAYQDKVSLSDDEVNQYYQNNPQKFLSQEKTSIVYVELNANDIKAQNEIDEEDIRRQYDEYVASLAGDEERKARHILVQIKEGDDDTTRAKKKQKIEDALKQLNQGISFEAVAKTVSDDPGSASQGGDLGWVGKGMMVPVFEQTLFALKEGETSKIIQSEFGYHIIKLEKIKGTQAESFEAKRAELVKSLQQQEIDNLFYERSELMATLAYENDDSLEPVVDALSIPAKHSTLFTRVQGQGIAKNEKLRQAAFSDLVLKEGRNSDVIELAKNHIVVFRTEQHQPAKPRPLSEVRGQVEQLLRTQKIQTLAQADSDRVMAQLQQGTALADVAKSNKLKLEKVGFVDRQSTKADRFIINEAFVMAKPSPAKPVYKTVKLARGLALVAVNGVKAADKIDTKESNELQQKMQTDISNREVMAFIGVLRSKADIIIADDLYNE